MHAISDWTHTSLCNHTHHRLRLEITGEIWNGLWF